MAYRDADIYDLKAYRNRQSAARLPAETMANVAASISPPSPVAASPTPRGEAISAASIAIPAAFFAFWPSLPLDQLHEHDGA